MGLQLKKRADGRHVGIIKSFNATLRMGKITCIQTQQDIAINDVELGEFGVGEKVCYTVAVDPQFGTPMAANVQFFESGQPPAKSARVTPNGKKTGSAQSAASIGARIAANHLGRQVARPNAVKTEASGTQSAKAPAKALTAAAPAEAPAVPDVRCVGVVTAFDEERYEGIIKREGGKPDVLVWGDELAGFGVGDKVSFMLSTDTGSPRASVLEAEA